MNDTCRILVLGGTAWLGRTVAARAAADGHEVTALARGHSGAVPDRVRFVAGDRWHPDAYDAVRGEDWDVVLDLGREPALVRSALAALSHRADHWIFVSTISVYSDHGAPGADESGALLPAWTGAGAAPAEVYGEAKVSCETACRAAMAAHRLSIVRPGLIVGYGDPSDRFGYWPARFARSGPGEQVLVPPPATPVQVIDVEDLAAWLVDLALRRLGGTFDAVGPPVTFAEVVQACAAVTDRSPELVDPGEHWLVEHGVTAWAGPDSLPLWVPGADYAGHAARAGAAARAAGLRNRPLVDTVADALRFEQDRGLDRPRKAGLSPERERSLLAEASASRNGP